MDLESRMATVETDLSAVRKQELPSLDGLAKDRIDRTPFDLIRDHVNRQNDCDERARETKHSVHSADHGRGL